MADEPLHNNNKRKLKYDPPPRCVSGFSDVPSYNNFPPPLDEIPIAKQKAQEIAARLLNSGDVKRLKFDDTYNDSREPKDKQVIKDPTPIIFYRNKDSKTFCFHTIEYDTITNHALMARSYPVFEFVGENRCVVCSCNGLLLIKTYNDQRFTTGFTVINPINKQCYELPKLTLRSSGESCGLGFDSSTNTFKMVCVFPNREYPYDPCSIVSKVMVHVFGTNAWRDIPQGLSYRIYGEGVFAANGCLHWLAGYATGGRQGVLWFDVKNEEFGLIQTPKTIRSKPSECDISPIYDHLVDLDGQVGYFVHETSDVWVLNHKKEWALHCNFEKVHKFPHGIVKVLGSLNKDGDILIKFFGKKLFHIYSLKERVLREARLDGLDWEDLSAMDIVMFPKNLKFDA